jgi:CRP-like cAMP-binding protein
MTNELLETLKAIPMFAPLGDADLERLVEVGRVEYWQEGALILEEGAVGPRMMVILDGLVEVLRRDRSGIQRAIAELGRGEILGEMSLLLDLPRTATVRSLGPLRVFAMDRGAFQELVEAGDAPTLKLGLALSKVLAQRLMRLNDRVLELLGQVDGGVRDRFHAARQEIFNLWDED